jgi:hypothetical protein
MWWTGSLNSLAGSRHYLVTLLAKTIGNLLLMLFDGVVGPDAQADNRPYNGPDNYGLAAPCRHRTMQSNYTGSGQRTKRAFSNCFEGSFSDVTAATEVKVYGELGFVEVESRPINTGRGTRR